MGKTKQPKGAEHACRIAYLFQAAERVVDLVPNLSQHYGQVMAIISQKTPMKLDYTLKRRICKNKNCKQLLKLGSTATYRLKRRKRGKRQKSKGYPTQIIRCQSCQTVKSFSTNPNHQLLNPEHKKKNFKIKTPKEVEPSLN